jgi:hypothetical protein
MICSGVKPFLTIYRHLLSFWTNTIVGLLFGGHVKLAQGFAFHRLVGIIKRVEPYVNPVTLKSCHCRPVCSRSVPDVHASPAEHF